MITLCPIPNYFRKKRRFWFVSGRTPDGKVVLFKKQPKELVESLKAREIVIDKHAKPQEAPIPEFSKQMKARVEKVRKALYGYSRNEKGEIERSR